MPAVLVSEDLEQIMQSYIPSRNVPDLKSLRLSNLPGAYSKKCCFSAMH